METEKKEEFHIDGSSFQISIVMSTFHQTLSDELLENTKQELLRNGIKEENIHITKVAGALEIPFICKKVMHFRKRDMIIALGVVIRGETTHYELVTKTTYEGLMQLQTNEGSIPIGFGILACENQEQAKHRISKNGLNKGKYVAQATLLQEYLVRNKL